MARHFGDEAESNLRPPSVLYSEPVPVACSTCEGTGQHGRHHNFILDCETCEGTGFQYDGDPNRPTNFAPGTDEKKALLQIRRARGIHLFLRGDRRTADGLAMASLADSIAEQDCDEEEYDCAHG